MLLISITSENSSYKRFPPEHYTSYKLTTIIIFDAVLIIIFGSKDHNSPCLKVIPVRVVDYISEIMIAAEAILLINVRHFYLLSQLGEMFSIFYHLIQPVQ